MTDRAVTGPARSPARAGADAAARAGPGFALYVHWPFCRAKCPYCDFNSHVRDGIDQARWREALTRELAHYAARAPGRVLDSIFFGGGTPSLMAAETVAAVIEAAAGFWTFAPDIEITLEANPTSAEAARFAGYRQAGVNRLSLGVQALDDRALTFLGREHDAAEALQAVALARRSFPRFSFDLIYARPGQTLAPWRDELTRALDRGARHLSLYQLTIEPGTRFHAAARRDALPRIEDGLAADLYEATQDILAEAGLPAYEISSHAAAGEASRHNLVYWRYGDYLGIGPGAHGRLTLGGTKHATRQHRAPEIWLERVEAAGQATTHDTPIAPDERRDEMMMMGLRLAEGVSLDLFRRETGRDLETCFDPERLDRLCAEGLLARTATALRATARGRRTLDAVLGYLLGRDR